MISELSILFGWAPDVVAQFSLVFIRIGAAIFVLPVFGEAMMPARVRLGAAFAFAFVTYPAVFDTGAFGQNDRSFPEMALAEAMTGLVLGLTLRLYIMAIQIAASIAAQSTSLSQLLGGNSIDPQPALGVVLYLAALALAVELGLHVQVALMFIVSYQSISPGTLIGSSSVELIRDAVAVAFRFGFVLAAPFVAVSLLYNLALGVINRAMPQLMVAFVGAPAITLGALVVLALSAPLILTIWVEAFQQRLVDPFGPP